MELSSTNQKTSNSLPALIKRLMSCSTIFFEKKQRAAHWRDKSITGAFLNARSLRIYLKTKYQSRTSLTVSKSPCAEYQLVPSTGLPDSPDRLYWFKPSVFDNLGIPDCLKALLACDFNRQFHPNDWLTKSLTVSEVLVPAYKCVPGLQNYKNSPSKIFQHKRM
jgi:hypothetical protein